MTTWEKKQVWAGGPSYVQPILAGAIGTGQGVTTLNDAHIAPFTISEPFAPTKVAINVSTQSGNIDIGILDSNLNLIYSKGSTACPSGSVDVTIAPGTLPAGQYYLVIAVDNVTAKFLAVTGGPGTVYKLFASAFPLSGVAGGSFAAASSTTKSIAGGCVLHV